MAAGRRRSGRRRPVGLWDESYLYEHGAIMLTRTLHSIGNGICGIALAAAMAASGHAQTPLRGGTLNVLSTTNIITLNPAIVSGVATATPGTQLFAGLVEYGSDWKPKPYLAQSWEISKDGLTYTFHLVKNAVFHDGQPITSADVAFSLEAVKKNHPFGQSMFGAVKAVDTPSPDTVVIHLSAPAPALMLSLSPLFMPVMPKHIYDTGNIRSNPHNNAPVGSGPFKFKEYKPGQYLVLERFDKFFRPGRPYLDRIVYTIIKGSTEQTLAIKRGDVQLSGFSPIGLQDVKRLQKDSRVIVTQKGYQAIGPLYWLEFNMRKAPYNDVRVRRAIAYAIDKQFIRSKLQLGLTLQAKGPIASESPFFEPDQNPYDLDLAKANKLLNEAGLKPNAQGIRFTARMDWLPSNRDYYQVTAEYMKPQLRKIGIDVQLRPAPDFSTWAQRISNWDFDMDVTAAYNYGDPTIGVARTYMSSNIRKGLVFSNTEGYANPKVDELLSAAAVEGDPARRKKLYSEFQKLVNSDVPVAFLFEGPIVTIYDKRLRNVPLGIWGTLSPMDAVYWDKKAEN